jgi:hypothetical protein
MGISFQEKVVPAGTDPLCVAWRRGHSRGRGQAPSPTRSQWDSSPPGITALHRRSGKAPQGVSMGNVWKVGLDRRRTPLFVLMMGATDTENGHTQWQSAGGKWEECQILTDPRLAECS